MRSLSSSSARDCGPADARGGEMCWAPFTSRSWNVIRIMRTRRVAPLPVGKVFENRTPATSERLDACLLNNEQEVNHGRL